MKKILHLILPICLMQSISSHALTYYIKIYSEPGIPIINTTCQNANYYFKYSNTGTFGTYTNTFPNPFIVNVGDVLIIVSGTNDCTINSTHYTGALPYQYVVTQSDVPQINFYLMTDNIVTLYCSFQNFTDPTLLSGTIQVQNITTDISNSKNEGEWNFFPNPLTDRLTIVAPENIGEVIITDLSGKIIIKQIIENTCTDINFNSLASGVYFIRTGGVTRKIIKQ